MQEHNCYDIGFNINISWQSSAPHGASRLGLARVNKVEGDAALLERTECFCFGNFQAAAARLSGGGTFERG
jgi:hypothetical protein